jgi:hypothetical protein
MGKLTFSGHESFHCRNLWLKKGYDFVVGNGKFTDPDAVIDLGVGKNMVSAIHYWMKSFGLIDGSNTTQLADFIFSKNGVDPYLENVATLWLLHYSLVTNEVASIYPLVFNYFRKKRIEFNKDHLAQFIYKKCEEISTPFNENTINRDILVFIKTYVKPSKSNKNLEELYSGLLFDLGLIESLKKFDEEEKSWYKIENKERKDIPSELILYCILANRTYGNSITFDDLLYGVNSVGNVFALSSKDLLEKISAICQNFKSVTFTEDGGIRVLQFKNKLNEFEVLRKYYEK